MHIDARKLNNNSIIEGDICIVGAGTAGISIALEWMNSPYKVILLEGGGFEYDDQVQDLNGGKTTGQKYFPLKSSRLRYFGGTTGHWAGMCSPLDHVDFRKRDWVPHSGWPIVKEDLDPFYARAHKTLGLGPYEYSFDYWRKEIPNLNPFPLDDKVVWNKMWQFSTARFGNLYRDTILKARNIHLYTYANVVNLEASEGVNSIREAQTRDHSGKTHTVRAKHFILACGAIQNARMLLASNKQAPAGLGNQNDVVGRYFMEHLEVSSAELWLTKPFPTDLYNWSYGVTRASAELAITEETQEQFKILNGTASFAPLVFAKHVKQRMEVWQNEDPRESAKNMFAEWDRAGAEAEKEGTGSIQRAYMLNTRIEQAPNPNSRVTLGSEKDGLGVPRASLNWEFTPLDKRSIRKIYELLGQQMGIAGLGRVKLLEFLRDENNYTFPDDTNGGWHHMGTTRMSEDPKKGVVDANCQVHGIQNLHVAGSGCFTTSGAPNPTLTLVSLSIRLSDYVMGKM